MIRSSIFSVMLNYTAFALTLIVSFLSVKLYLIHYGIEYAGKINILIMVKGLMELSSGFITSKQVQIMMYGTNNSKPFRTALNFAFTFNLILFPIVVISLSILLELFEEVIWFALYTYTLQILTVYLGRLNSELRVFSSNFIKMVILLPASTYVVLCYFFAWKINFSLFIINSVVAVCLVLIPLIYRYKSDLKNIFDFNCRDMFKTIIISKSYLCNSVLVMALPLVEISIISNIFGFEVAALYAILIKLPNAIGIIAQKSVDPLAPYFAKAKYSSLGKHLRHVVIGSSVVIFITVIITADDMYHFWLGDEVIDFSGEYNIFLALAAVGTFVSKTKSAALFYTKSITQINWLLALEFVLRMLILYFSYQYFGVFSMYSYVIATYILWLRLR